MRITLILSLAVVCLLAGGKARSIYEPENVEEYIRDPEDDGNSDEQNDSLENDEDNDDLFEGDILIEEGDFSSEESDDDEDSDESDEGGNGLKNKKYRWPKTGDNVIVPYVIEEEKYEQVHLDMIQEAIDMIESTTCVKFQNKKEKDDKRRHHVWITFKKEGCFSKVGKTSGANQIVNLAHKCFKKAGRIAHELIHALGFFHMQSHPKRDEHVRVLAENIKDGKLKNYKKLTKKISLGFDTPYDYYSIMHYGPKYFSKNGQLTMETLDKQYQDKIGQRNKLSPADIIRINRMYVCKKRKHVDGDTDNDADDDSEESSEADATEESHGENSENSESEEQESKNEEEEESNESDE